MEETRSSSPIPGSLAGCSLILLLYLFGPAMLFPVLGEGFDETGQSALAVFIYLSVIFQLIRFPLLRRLLSKKWWRSDIATTATLSWFTSLFLGVLVAVPLVNLSLRLTTTRSIFVTREWSAYLYGQFVLNGYEFGVPDYFIAIAGVILIDALLLWAFARLRPAAFVTSLKAAAITDGVVYGGVTVVSLLLYVLVLAGL